MAEEELAFGGHGRSNVFAAVDVALRSVHHSDVSAPQWQQTILEDVARVRAVVHQVQLGDDADRAQT